MTKQEIVPAKPGSANLSTPRYDLFSNLQREVDRLFQDFGRGFERYNLTPLAPRIDMAEADGSIEITAELPGLEEKDVEVTLVDDLLTISGEKRTESEKSDKNYHLVERSSGAFSRTIQLPPGVDASKVKATMAKGVLKVVAPKPAQDKAVKIEVRAGA
jgi:HSP20 family protein